MCVPVAQAARYSPRIANGGSSLFGSVHFVLPLIIVRRSTRDKHNKLISEERVLSLNAALALSYLVFLGFLSLFFIIVPFVWTPNAKLCFVQTLTVGLSLGALTETPDSQLACGVGGGFDCLSGLQTENNPPSASDSFPTRKREKGFFFGHFAQRAINSDYPLDYNGDARPTANKVVERINGCSPRKKSSTRIMILDGDHRLVPFRHLLLSSAACIPM